MKECLAKLHESWLDYLEPEFEKAYLRDLSAFLRAEEVAGHVIYPSSDNLFSALNSTLLEQVKVVIIGQDPYHGSGQAHGLSFSVLPGVAIPPSLKNVYKELHSDLGCEVPPHGNLQSWADQGVLLLNSVLSVRQSSAGSHQGKGWEQFTDQIIRLVNQHCKHVVFLLWGGYAQKKGLVIDQKAHSVLLAPHPSPLSAYRGFLGCRHFSKANVYLVSQGRKPIDWQIR